MAVSPARTRDLALALADTAEAPHCHRTAFRTRRLIFATLDAGVPDLNLMFDPELRDFYCTVESRAFRPVPGGWGRRGATRCDLTLVDEATLLSALKAAHRLVTTPRPHRGRP